MTHRVKSRRPYDASQRRARAADRRSAVLKAAHELFRREGFAATTVAAVAAQAGVSPETVYKNFGSKPGLVRALHEEALRGQGPVPAYRRSEALRTSADPLAIVRGWSRLSMELAPRGSPLLLLVRDAASLDPDLRRLLDELDGARHERMTENARFLRDAGHLRADVSVQTAADL
ncbi:MAG TPA: TetR family transcriptional regulator, partial [Marmoricola sp.]|nr:TetR family transcriptional regulator [Marmoricola sp.]